MYKIIFGTNNERKIKDLKSILKELNYNVEILTLKDIGWTFGPIEEPHDTLEENSIYKAATLLGFCQNSDYMNYPIITDSSALVFKNLDDESGIYTERYADDELDIRPIAPDYQCLFKLLRNLKKYSNRDATYKCAITLMLPSGSYYQEVGETKGYIADTFLGTPEQPFYYSVFMVGEYDKLFNELNKEQLQDTFRHKALRKILTKEEK